MLINLKVSYFNQDHGIFGLRLIWYVEPSEPKWVNPDDI